MKNKLKTVLVVAYACEPKKTSEPGVGWNFTREIAKIYTTIVLTRANNKTAIKSEGDTNISYIYYDLPRIFILLKKTLPLGTQLYYSLWQWGAYFHVRKKMKKSVKSIDILHHLNFGISWVTPPSFLLKIPFVWGPIGGGDNVPFRFLKKMPLKAVLQEILYHAVNQIIKISPLSHLTKKKSNAILFRTTTAKKNLGKTSAIVKIVSETASPDKNRRQPKEHSKTVHAICVGRMNYWKGYIFAVKGFHQFLQKGGEGVLEIFGEGPERPKIEKYIKSNQLEKHILMQGFVNNELIKKKMQEATILLHPSFREGGSWSIMEAMSFGLPVICLNTSGPKDMVTNQCGLLINLTSSSQIFTDVGKGLLELSRNKALYETYSKNAVKRIASEYNWDRRREQIKEVYDQILN